MLGMLAACGGEGAPDHDSTFVRLDFSPAPDAIPLAPVTDGPAFQIAEEPGRWEIQAKLANLKPVQAGTDAMGMVLKGDIGGAPIQLVRTGNYDLSKYNQVRVSATFRGFGHVRVAFYREGELLTQSETVFLVVSDSPTVLDVDVPTIKGDPKADTMQLYVGGANRLLGFLGVQFRNVPLARHLPDPAGPPEIVVLKPRGSAASSRLGEGVTVERPLEIGLDVPAAATLRLSYAQPGYVWRESVPSTLRLLIRPEGSQEPARSRVLAESDRTDAIWQMTDVDLADYAGQRVRIRVEVDAGAATGAAWAVAEATLLQRGTTKPSILLITTDTHRADHLGAANPGVEVSTPVVDALAARGVIFDNCFAPTNVTNPSHISLHTGTHPRDTGIFANQQPLGDGALTLAEIFKDNGYLTYATLSTNHLGHVSSGLGQGFDRMNWPEKKPRDSKLTLDVVDDWMDDVGDRPVFLWVHVFDAHWPYAPPGRFDRMYYDQDKDPFDESLPEIDPGPRKMPPDLVGLRDLEFPRAQYRGEVAYQDEQLARVLELPRFQRGLVALTSDHGEAMGENKVFFDHAELYPETVHIPMVLAGDGLPAGVRVAEPITHIDLGRSLLDLVGLGHETFPGRSLLPVIAGYESRSREPRYLLSSGGHSAAVEFGDLYAIIHLRKHRADVVTVGFEKHQVELFDRSDDPECTIDLVDTRPAIAKQMRDRLVRWLKDAQNMGWASESTADAEQLATLAALGYTHGIDDDAPLWTDDNCAWCQRFE